MYNSWFEQIRFPLQSIENLEKAIVGEMLLLKDTPKQRSIIEHHIYNYTQIIHQKSRQILQFLREEIQIKKEQLEIISGNKSLKVSQKKKTSDVIWQNFYDKSREIKQYFKKNQISDKKDIPSNNIEFFKRIVFLPPFKQPEFSLQQCKGKYVDMHNIYVQYLNIFILFQEKQGLKLHDYLWFLQNLDKFDDFPLNKKMKYHHKYLTYLRLLSSYLQSFIRKSRPLFHIQSFLTDLQKKFQTKYQEDAIHGWEKQLDNLDQKQWQYCNYCQKLYIRDRAYIDHLSGKNHEKQLKNKQKIDMNSPQIAEQLQKREQESKKQFKKQHEYKKKLLIFQQYKIISFRQQLSNIIYDTMNLIRKKQTRGYQEIDQFIQQSQQSSNADAPIYNPKNLPLGWDGKPIPYWLYKLHGLGIEYKCEICGNYSYWGRRAFEMHFQEWRHTYGMKCLKIPNTIHFKDVTTITDALALHQKLMRQSQQSQFRPDLQEEFQDNQGNILNKRTFMDMKKQGLID